MKNILKNTVALSCAAVFAFGNFSTGSTVSAENINSNNSQLTADESNLTLEAAGGNETDKTTATTATKTNKTNKTDVATPAATGGTAYSATAYALRGKTASGAGVRRGIIAADPRVLPLGTRVQISAGAWSGNYLVADTGGAIKGRKIDVWVASNSEAMKFGRRKITLKVLGKK